MKLVIASDLHINSTVALCPPVVNLDDGGTYHAGRIQHWLWECWNDDWKEIGGYNDSVAVIFNGDLGELDTRRRSNQLITANKATIIRLAIEAITPAVLASDRVYFVRGTAAHEGKSAWLEEAIANDTDTVGRDTERGTASWWHLRGVMNGARIDASHHAGMGGAPWTRRNAANNLAAKIMWYYSVDMEQKAPHIVFRSHNHLYADSGDNYKTKVYFTPAWTPITEYGYRIGKENELADIGLLVFDITDGEINLIKRFKHDVPTVRRVWSVKL